MNGTTLLEVGAPAPEISARASDGKWHSLADYLERGAVALFFYPGNDTPG
jgi:peroxiredoxin